MALPAPAMRRDFVAALNRVACQSRRTLYRSTAGAHCDFAAKSIEQIHQPPPTSARAIFEMALDAWIGSLDALVDFIDALVAGISFRHREFSTFLEIDNDGNSYSRFVGPARFRWCPRIAKKIASTIGRRC